MSGCTLKSPGELLKLLVLRLYSRPVKLEFLGFRAGQKNFESFSNDFDVQPRLRTTGLNDSIGGGECTTS